MLNAKEEICEYSLLIYCESSLYPIVLAYKAERGFYRNSSLNIRYASECGVLIIN